MTIVLGQRHTHTHIYTNALFFTQRERERERERERDGWKFAFLHPVNHDHCIRAKTHIHIHIHTHTHTYTNALFFTEKHINGWGTCIHCTQTKYTSHFGCMVGKDCSNPMQLDLSILNILAATQYSQNRQVKARRRSMHSTPLLLKSYHPLWSGLSFTSVQAAGAPRLADAVHPFGIQQAVLGPNRFKVQTDDMSYADPFDTRLEQSSPAMWLKWPEHQRLK